MPILTQEEINKAKTDVGTAFTGAVPTGLTPEQQSAFVGVQTAFAPKPLVTDTTRTTAPTTGTGDLTNGTTGLGLTGTASTGFGTGITSDILRQQQFESSQKTTDPNVIREQSLDRFQGEIDSISAFYDAQIQEARLKGAETLKVESGRGRSLRASGGILGTLRGATQAKEIKTEVESETQRQVDIIQREKMAKVSGLLGEARDYEIERTEDEKLAKESGVESYISWLDSVEQKDKERAELLISSMVAQGIESEDISDEDIRNLSRMLGVSEGELGTIYQGALASTTTEGEDPLKGATATLRDYSILQEAGQLDPSVSFIDYKRQIALAGKVSSTTDEEGDEQLSVWDIQQLTELYPNVEINAGDTMNDVKEKQVAQFVKDNEDKSQEELTGAIPDTHRNIFEKFAVWDFRTVNKILGIGGEKGEEKEEEKDTEGELTELFNSI